MQGSPVTEAISAAVARTAGVALGGAATFIPLLERCGTETLLQVPLGTLGRALLDGSFARVAGASTQVFY